MPSSPSQPPRRSHSRSRSRSPPPRRRTDDRPRPSASGFRWKDKSSQPSDDPYDRRHDDRRLERGYRDRDARERDRDRDRYRERDDQRDGGRPHREPRDPRHEDREGARSRDEARGDEGDRRGRGGERRNDNVDDGTRRDPFGETTTDGTATKAKKEKKTREPKIAPTAEPMIIVNVNDRLGTKAAIPCLASDSIRGFKAMVAMRIGREPHEIMLKRQGERPFKDMLTLEDYGVSNGVQLDLEVDTGD
ncbi:MAG: hypothetical protein LQ344_005367 [Seirophora lacunosa]|nr:MAG: hypothetical protein LQ344_005367 [Seirophora lacunosa]